MSEPQNVYRPPKARRRPALVALAVALIAVGALLASFVVTTLSNTVEVLAVKAEVPLGRPLGSGDLRKVSVNADTQQALNLALASDAKNYINQKAKVRLLPNTLLSKDFFGPSNIRVEGNVFNLDVGVAQAPIDMLQPGSRVTVHGGKGSKVATVSGTVVSIREYTDAKWSIAVEVSRDAANDMAAIAQTEPILSLGNNPGQAN